MAGTSTAALFSVTVVTFFQFTQATVLCGNTLCAGFNAYCCEFNSELCCFSYIWSFWWFWMIWLLFFLMISSCTYLCRRRYVRRREMVVVGQPQPVYGSMVNGSMVNQGYVEHAPVYAAAPPKPPAYAPPEQKPPAYSPA